MRSDRAEACHIEEAATLCPSRTIVVPSKVVLWGLSGLLHQLHRRHRLRLGCPAVPAGLRHPWRLSAPEVRSDRWHLACRGRLEGPAHPAAPSARSAQERPGCPARPAVQSGPAHTGAGTAAGETAQDRAAGSGLRRRRNSENDSSKIPSFKARGRKTPALHSMPRAERGEHDRMCTFCEQWGKTLQRFRRYANI